MGPYRISLWLKLVIICGLAACLAGAVAARPPAAAASPLASSRPQADGPDCQMGDPPSGYRWDDKDGVDNPDELYSAPPYQLQSGLFYVWVCEYQNRPADGAFDIVYLWYGYNCLPNDVMQATQTGEYQYGDQTVVPAVPVQERGSNYVAGALGPTAEGALDPGWMASYGAVAGYVAPLGEYHISVRNTYDTARRGAPTEMSAKDFMPLASRIVQAYMPGADMLERCKAANEQFGEPPPQQPLGVAASCQASQGAAGDAQCAAQAVNAPAGAQLSYAWTVDGQPQGESGSQLNLTGLAPGAHNVSVTVYDAVSGQQGGPQTFTFDVSAEGAVSSGGGSGTAAGEQPLGGEEADGSEPAGEPSGGEAVPGGGGLVGTLIGLGVLAGVGVLGAAAVSHIRRPKPKPSASTGAATSKPARPGSVPEAGTKTTQPAASRTPPKPGTVPEGGLRAVPPPDRPPEAAARPPQQQQHQQGEIWLQTDKTAVRVHADKKDIAAVSVRAFRTEGSRVVDVTREVAWEANAAPDFAQKIYFVDPPRNDTLEILASHIGVTPVLTSVTITATHPSNRPIKPVTIAVTVDPMRVTIKVYGWKQGFATRDYVETLARSCSGIRGQVLSAAQRAGIPLLNDEEYPIAYARCQGILLVDNYTKGHSIEVQTDDRGKFQFVLPGSFVMQYGAEEGIHDLLAALRLDLDEEVEEQRNRFRSQVAELARIPAFVSISKRCREYEHPWFRQLCDRPEDKFPVIMSALNLLRASIVFVRKYLHDFEAQRRRVQVEFGACVGSAFDLFTDYVPFVSGFVDWTTGEAVQITVGKRSWVLPGLQQLVLAVARRTQGTWVGRLMLRGLILGIKGWRATMHGMLNALSFVANKAFKLAEKLNLSTQAMRAAKQQVDRLNSRSVLDTSGLPPDAVGNLAELHAELKQGFIALARLIGNGFMLLVYVVVLAVAQILKIVGAVVVHLLANLLPQASIVTEAIEMAIGQIIGYMYETVVARMAAWANNPAAPVQGDDLGTLVSDRVVSVDDMNQACVEALDEALRKSIALEVPEDWSAAVKRIVKTELKAMTAWKERADSIEWIDWLAAWGKLLSKCLQGFFFGIAGLADLAVRQLIDAGRGPGIVGHYESIATRRLGRGDLVEHIANVAEAVFVRVPILAAEICDLLVTYHTVELRIKQLYH